MFEFSILSFLASFYGRRTKKRDFFILDFFLYILTILNIYISYDALNVKINIYLVVLAKLIYYSNL